MALGDILRMGAMALPNYRPEDRAKVQEYKSGLADYRAKIDAYNQGIGSYNAAVEEWKKLYDPWAAKAEEYNKAVDAWNAGPQTGTAPVAPAPWSGPDAPTAPTAPFTEEQLAAYSNEAGNFLRQAAAKVSPSTMGRQLAYAIYGSPTNTISYGVPGGGTSIDFSFSGAGFAQGGVVPPMRQGIGSIFKPR